MQHAPARALGRAAGAAAAAAAGGSRARRRARRTRRAAARAEGAKARAYTLRSPALVRARRGRRGRRERRAGRPTGAVPCVRCAAGRVGGPPLVRPGVLAARTRARAAHRGTAQRLSALRSRAGFARHHAAAPLRVWCPAVSPCTPRGRLLFTRTARGPRHGVPPHPRGRRLWAPAATKRRTSSTARPARRLPRARRNRPLRAWPDGLPPPRDVLTPRPDATRTARPAQSAARHISPHGALRRGAARRGAALLAGWRVHR